MGMRALSPIAASLVTGYQARGLFGWRRQKLILENRGGFRLRQVAQILFWVSLKPMRILDHFLDIGCGNSQQLFSVNTSLTQYVIDVYLNKPSYFTNEIHPTLIYSKPFEPYPVFMPVYNMNLIGERQIKDIPQQTHLNQKQQDGVIDHSQLLIRVLFEHQALKGDYMFQLAIEGQFDPFHLYSVQPIGFGQSFEDLDIFANYQSLLFDPALAIPHLTLNFQQAFLLLCSGLCPFTDNILLFDEFIFDQANTVLYYLRICHQFVISSYQCLVLSGQTLYSVSS